MCVKLHIQFSGSNVWLETNINADHGPLSDQACKGAASRAAKGNSNAEIQDEQSHKKSIDPHKSR